MRPQCVAGLSMHSLKTWSRLVRISCSVLQHCGKRHWLTGTLLRTPYICIASTAWCAKGKALLENAGQSDPINLCRSQGRFSPAYCSGVSLR
jgi:hypothetical protein